VDGHHFAGRNGLSPNLRRELHRGQEHELITRVRRLRRCLIDLVAVMSGAAPTTAACRIPATATAPIECAKARRLI
jgi:hypothetical protein